MPTLLRRSLLFSLAGCFALASAGADRAIPFADEFDDNKHEWPRIKEGDTWIGKIEKGALSWENTSLDPARYESMKVPLALDATKAFEIEFAVRFGEGLADREFGVEWGCKGAIGYGFVFTQEGSMRANNWDGTRYVGTVPWEAHPALKKGEFIRCVIRRIGNSCYYFVGDDVVTKIGFTGMPGPEFGVYAFAGVAAEFDYLRVKYLAGNDQALAQQAADYDRRLLARTRAKGPAAVDFAEEFNDNSRQWPFMTEGKTWKSTIENGVLTWENRAPPSQGGTQVTSIAMPIAPTHDFEISWRAKLVGGIDKQFIGLRWGGASAPSRFHCFRFVPSGSFNICTYDGTKWINPVLLTATSAVKKTDFNEIILRRVGDTVYHFINGQLLAALPFVEPMGSDIGFEISDGMHAAFDSLRLKYLPDRSAEEKATLYKDAVAQLVKASKDAKLGVFLTDSQYPVSKESINDSVHEKNITKLQKKYHLKPPESFMADYGRPVAVVSHDGQRQHALYYNYSLIGRKQWYYVVSIEYDVAGGSLGGSNQKVRRWIDSVYYASELPPN